MAHILCVSANVTRTKLYIHVVCYFLFRSEANDLALRLARHYTKGIDAITVDQ